MIKLLVFFFCLFFWKNSLQTELFLDQWLKKPTLSHLIKNSDNQLVKNYRPVSLLPVCGKEFERLIFNCFFDYFKEKNLFLPH